MIEVSPPTLTSTINELSTMTTPAVLIIACGSPILGTSVGLIGSAETDSIPTLK